MGELAFVLVIAGFESIADEWQERIWKLLTKTPVIKRQLSFLRVAGINHHSSKCHMFYNC